MRRAARGPTTRGSPVRSPAVACAAAEFADASDYLAFGTTRTRVADRVRQWARRRIIVDPRIADWAPGACPWSAPDPGPRYRFGDLFDLLLDHDAHRTPDRTEET